MSTQIEQRTVDLSPEARDRLQASVKAAGGQSEIARRLGISRQGLNSVLRGGKGVSSKRLRAICEAVGVEMEWVLADGDGQASASQAELVRVPIVEIEASAGPGRNTANRPSVVDHLPMPGWLARQLGSVDSLEIVIARGDSGSPEIHDGDLVMMDRSKPYRGEGMYVIVLDGDLMVKRVQRTGSGMRIASINTAYQPIDLPAEEVDERLQMLGRVVWTGKQW